MAAIQKRMVSISDDQGGYIDEKVASGAYANASEVVQAGLDALQERDAAFERRLRDEVLPVLDHLLAHPETALSADEVFGRLRARHAARIHASERRHRG